MAAHPASVEARNQRNTMLSVRRHLEDLIALSRDQKHLMSDIFCDLEALKRTASPAQAEIIDRIYDRVRVVMWAQHIWLRTIEFAAYLIGRVAGAKTPAKP